MDATPKSSNKTQRKEVFHKFKVYIVSHTKARSAQAKLSKKTKQTIQICTAPKSTVTENTPPQWCPASNAYEEDTSMSR